MLDNLKWILIGISGLFVLYVIIRVIVAAAAKSWYEIKNKENNGGSQNEKS